MELAIYEAFREAGIEEAKAKAIHKTIHATINAAIEKTVDLSQLATKSDIEQLRLETKAEIEKTKADIIKWNIGAIIAAAGLAMAIARFFAA